MRSTKVNKRKFEKTRKHNTLRRMTLRDVIVPMKMAFIKYRNLYKCSVDVKSQSRWTEAPFGTRQNERTRHVLFSSGMESKNKCSGWALFICFPGVHIEKGLSLVSFEMIACFESNYYLVVFRLWHSIFPRLVRLVRPSSYAHWLEKSVRRLRKCFFLLIRISNFRKWYFVDLTGCSN